MRKNKKAEQPTIVPVALTNKELEAIYGGIDGGLSRDLIRRKA